MWYFRDNRFLNNPLFDLLVLGVFVFSATAENVSVMFPSGAGVEVRAREATMTATVLLPLEFTNHTQGLLGRMNDDPEDDLISSDGQSFDASQSRPEDLFRFGSTCEYQLVI